MIKTLFSLYSGAKTGKETLEDPEAVATGFATGIVLIPLIIWSGVLILLGGISAVAGYVVWDYDFFKFTTWIFGLSLLGIWSLFFILRSFLKRAVGAVKNSATSYARGRFRGSAKKDPNIVDVKEV